MISPVVASRSAFLSTVFDISREITRVAGNTRDHKKHMVPRQKIEQQMQISRIFLVLYGGQCLDVTNGLESYAWHPLVFITSTKCPHLHLLVWRYRYAFWYEVGEVSRKCCFMHQRRDRRRKTTTTKPRNPGKLTAELRDLATWWNRATRSTFMRF